jgi:thioredoxin type arsenate reductase
VKVEPVRLLFVCTGNSCRSQMAEGLARILGGERVRTFSAGTDPRPVHPLAVRVMTEVDVDISKQRSKHIDVFANERFDFAITVYDRARQQCPAIPGAPQQIHWGFDDPAGVAGSEEERLRAFRRVRDEIRQRLRLLLLANDIVRRERTP